MKKHLLYWISILSFISLLNSSCKKKDFTEGNLQFAPSVSNSIIKSKFFSITDSISPGLSSVMQKIKDQDDQSHFIENIVDRYGFPIWSQTISNEITIADKTNRDLTSASIASPDGDTILYFIPFKKDSIKNINAFLACIKVDDNYIFKIHKRYQYEYGSPKKIEKKQFGRAIMAIFGIFEKRINFVDSISIKGNYNEIISNYKYKFKRKDGSVANFDQSVTRDSYEIRAVTYCVDSKPCDYCAYARATVADDILSKDVATAQLCYTEYYIRYTTDGTSGGSTGSGGRTGSGGSGAGGGGSTGTGGTTVTGFCTSADWWCESGEYRVNKVTGEFYTPENYPYKDEGWEWLWWEKPMTDHETQVFNQLDLEDQQANTTLNLDCKGTQRTGNFSWSGTREHWLVMLDYISKNAANGEIEYAIPGSGSNGGRGYADIVNRMSGEIFEVKPPSLLAQGISEVDNYVLKANQHCLSSLTGASLFKKGTNYSGTIISDPWNPQRVLETNLGANGVVTYTYKDRVTNPLPISIPSSALDKVRNLVNKLKDKVTDYDTIIRTFLQRPENRELLVYLKAAAYGAATAIVVGTIIEDFLTVGVGIANDWASFTLAYRIVRVARSL